MSVGIVAAGMEQSVNHLYESVNSRIERPDARWRTGTTLSLKPPQVHQQVDDGDSVVEYLTPPYMDVLHRGGVSLPNELCTSIVNV